MVLRNNNTAFMMTQYERFGRVGRDEYIENYIREELEIDESMISAFNEYLSDRGYESYFSFDEIDLYLEGMEPYEIFRLGSFSNVNFSDDYLKFNGYGNLESFTKYQVIEEMKEDTDFLKWYVENYIDLDEEEIEEAVNDCNVLIAAGF